MEIISDKLNSEPPHSVRRQDVKLVLDIIPDEWVGIKNIFHISAQFFESSQWDRPVIQNNLTYKILSRGLSKDFVIRELLIELAIKATKKHPTNGHKLAKEQRKGLKEFIVQYFKQKKKKKRQLRIISL
jgi:hypothetical protein